MNISKITNATSVLDLAYLFSFRHLGNLDLIADRFYGQNNPLPNVVFSPCF